MLPSRRFANLSIRVCLLIVGVWPVLAHSQEAALDHFECFETHRPPIDVAGVSLIDELGSRTVRIKRAKRICAPADKNGENPTAPNAPGYLTGYTLRQTSARLRPVRGVTVTNQLGTLVVDLVKLDRVLVPTATGTASLPPATLDHYACYRVQGSKERRPNVSLTTAFGAHDVDVKRPLHLCTPVDKNGEEIVDASAHLMCYQIRGARRAGPYDLATSNQLGQDEVDVFGARELCVPSIADFPADACATEMADPPVEKAPGLLDCVQNPTDPWCATSTIIEPERTCACSECACIPTLCGETQCGQQSDGCGGLNDCGPCCAPTETCGEQCGTVEDGCDGALDCPSCESEPCTPPVCAPDQCNVFDNGCGVVDCGPCPSTCQPAECGPTDCGSHSDGCGTTTTCGSCDDLGAGCGSCGEDACGIITLPDECGGATLDCGICPQSGTTGLRLDSLRGRRDPGAGQGAVFLAEEEVAGSAKFGLKVKFYTVVELKAETTFTASYKTQVKLELVGDGVTPVYADAAKGILNPNTTVKGTRLLTFKTGAAVGTGISFTAGIVAGDGSISLTKSKEIISRITYGPDGTGYKVGVMMGNQPGGIQASQVLGKIANALNTPERTKELEDLHVAVLRSAGFFWSEDPNIPWGCRLGPDENGGTTRVCDFSWCDYKKSHWVDVLTGWYATDYEAYGFFFGQRKLGDVLQTPFGPIAHRDILTITSNCDRYEMKVSTMTSDTANGPGVSSLHRGNVLLSDGLRYGFWTRDLSMNPPVPKLSYLRGAVYP